jgi:hypothetical protein
VTAGVYDRQQDVRLTPEPIGGLSTAGLVVVACRDLVFGDFGPHDLFGFGLWSRT